MTKTDETFKIMTATTENFNLIYDGLENYFIFYDGEKVGDKINDITKPKELLKIVNARPYNDVEEKEDNPTIKALIQAIGLEYEKPHQRLRILKQILNDLIYVMEDENLYLQHFKKANTRVREFVIELTIDYGYDNIFADNEANPGNTTDFNKIFNSYDNNWFDMLETELFDYVDNTENVFKGLINSLCALYGYGSRFIVVNGGSEVGKSEYIQTIKKLMPDFINLGSSTPASIRRKDTDEFNKKIVYLGDKGLKGTDDEEFKGLQEVFGGLITENEFIREIIVGNEPIMFNLKSDGVCVFYSQPYTNLQVFGAGDQYRTRSTFIIVNPVNDGLSVFLQDENKTNNFYKIHKDYIRYILNNPLDLTISDEVKTVLWQSSKESLRTAKYLLGLFKAYCQYMQVGNPLETDVMEFLDVFKPKYEVTEIEYMIYERLYKHLKTLTDKKFKDEFKNGWNTEKDMLNSREKRETKTFFTAKQIKTYFSTEFKRNKNLKDTIDNMPDILNNLFKAGLINRIESQYQGQNVYYIPYNEDMQK